VEKQQQIFKLNIKSLDLLLFLLEHNIISKILNLKNIYKSLLFYIIVYYEVSIPLNKTQNHLNCVYLIYQVAF